MRQWITRHRLVLLVLLGPGFAVTSLIGPSAAQTARETAALDQLFNQLKHAADAGEAQAITSKIWIYWTTPADPVLAGKMADVLALRQRADFSAVMTLLDEIVAQYPTYAEGWNQRATVHFLLHNYRASLEDIKKTLEFEPRHFGALVGRAVIYKNLGQDELALRDMITAMSINPFLAERALFPELEDIQFI